MECPQSWTHPQFTSPRILLSLLILTVVLPTSTGNTRVTVKLNKYTNTDNTKDQDDRFCNDDQSPCNIQFDVKFVNPLKVLFKTTPRVVEEIIFADSITDEGGNVWPNPFPGNEEEQTVTKGIEKLQFVLDVWHVAVNGDKTKIVRFYLQRWFDTWGSETTTLTDKLGYSSLDLTTTIDCAPDYYRKPVPPTDTAVSNCTYCVETDKYTCSPADGSKVCKPGWQGVNCDIVAPQNCPAIKEANSIITPPTYKKDTLKVGYTVTFSCPGPYLSYLSSSPFMSCLDTGQWNSTVPSCIPVVDNIDEKMNSLRDIGLYVLGGVLLTFGSAVMAMTYITGNMISSNAATLGKEATAMSPHDEKFQYAEETGFEPEYTDKTYLVGEAGPEPRYEVGVKSSQQLKVNMKNMDVAVEDVDF